eukprot:4944090-Prymnesium_polylepis.1
MLIDGTPSRGTASIEPTKKPSARPYCDARVRTPAAKAARHTRTAASGGRRSTLVARRPPPGVGVWGVAVVWLTLAQPTPSSRR